MQFSIRWVPHVTTSCLHVADAICRGETIVDPRLVPALGETAHALHDEMKSFGLDEPRLWRQLLCMAHQFENKRQLAKITLYRAFGMSQTSEVTLGALAGRISDLEQAYLAAFPDIAEQLELRSRPLREQWEARGPGLLHFASQRFQEVVVVPGADVLLVQPARGGFGQAQLYNNTVRMEAVLANPDARLPEVVRLAWMFLQLNLDVPVLSEKVHGSRLPLVAALAMIPVTLSAAAEVELVNAEPELLALALEHWHLPVENPHEVALRLAAWWIEYVASQPSLSIALPALDEMLD